MIQGSFMTLVVWGKQVTQKQTGTSQHELMWRLAASETNVTNFLSRHGKTLISSTSTLARDILTTRLFVMFEEQSLARAHLTPARHQTAVLWLMLLLPLLHESVRTRMHTTLRTCPPSPSIFFFCSFVFCRQVCSVPLPPLDQV